ncbi:hypothetical protein AJ85_09700 [Alkalihalobacillus alcalophilus ATCC 27647 = CGMCC 1.3604]|uniref:Uncharacterized protein n=1 Tax=Alkalihalobacillus alcalophilus ATCC 27647 = CGMCC 1.3604 TaxID=1218173 RepID=A0A094YSB7_ALKAL|nr:hypothetical protein [Alkalihalobacillus alcalophilus]KGA96377.1 hypothetical protein BALCAV_0216635 [Alkalihalobacillus alcalophilus ATCC 27647 = CGMCC 1.3604]MED1563484.1 hypothetical protein [Alkalihalobacillus alcalophilus]THG90605.1 hypothetical protein AJ85_09700 [Alkalihalobacillus alcalophilus ATCC 27647 = CGMCC 1.3604]
MNIKLLEEIILKREPGLYSAIIENKLKNIDSDSGNHIRSILTDELLETGMDDSEESNINARGIAIEKLIDDVGNLFM